MPPITIALGLSQEGRGSRRGEEAHLQAALPHWGEHEAAPSLTFQDRDNRVKINSQAPVAVLASLLHNSYLSPFGDRKVPFRSPFSLPLPSPEWGGSGEVGFYLPTHACSLLGVQQFQPLPMVLFFFNFANWLFIWMLP